MLLKQKVKMYQLKKKTGMKKSYYLKAQKNNSV